MLALLHVVLVFSLEYTSLIQSHTQRSENIWTLLKSRLLIKTDVVILWLYVRVFDPLVSLGRLVYRYIFNRSPLRTVGNRCVSILSRNPSRFYSISFYWMSVLNFWEFSCFFTAVWIVGTKTSPRLFSNVAQIFLICLAYSLNSGNTVLQRALIMMQFSGQSSPVSFSVLICMLTFGLQSEYSTNMFHVSGYFYTAGFGVYKTAYL